MALLVPSRSAWSSAVMTGSRTIHCASRPRCLNFPTAVRPTLLLHVTRCRASVHWGCTHSTPLEQRAASMPSQRRSGLLQLIQPLLVAHGSQHASGMHTTVVTELTTNATPSHQVRGLFGTLSYDLCHYDALHTFEVCTLTNKSVPHTRARETSTMPPPRPRCSQALSFDIPICTSASWTQHTLLGLYSVELQARNTEAVSRDSHESTSSA